MNKTHFITLLRKEKDRLKNSSDCFIQFPIHFPVAYINKIIQRKKKKIKINDQYKLHINNFKSSSLMTLVHIYFITVEIGFQKAHPIGGSRWNRGCSGNLPPDLVTTGLLYTRAVLAYLWVVLSHDHGEDYRSKKRNST